MLSPRQQLATIRNWIQFYIVKPIHLTCGREYIVYSPQTYRLLEEVNAKILELKSSIDEDWKRTRESLPQK